MFMFCKKKEQFQKKKALGFYREKLLLKSMYGWNILRESVNTQNRLLAN